jgi:hypothetical protein
MAVVGFVADVPRPRQRDRPQDLAVVGRGLVKVHHREKVRAPSSVIAGPDKEGSLFGLVVNVGLSVGSADAREQHQQTQI